MLLLGVVILVLLYLGLRKASASSPGKVISSNPEAKKVQSEIVSILTAAGYSSRMAQNWVRVSAFETGYWTSNLYRTKNNLFGMKQPEIRDTTSAGTPGVDTWAVFPSQAESVRDLVLYLKARNYPNDFPSLESQIAFMKEKSYFEEPFEYYYNGVNATKV